MSAPVGATGIDVSRWQGPVDWAKVAAAGVRFAWVNASNQDPSGHYRGARAAGLAAGLYWRLPADVVPEVAARAFALHVTALGAVAGPGVLPPCLDLEDGTGNQSGRGARFLAELRARTGAHRVVVYSGAWFFQNSIGEAWCDSDVILWIADYSAVPGHPRYRTPRVACHQYSSTGRVPGVHDNCDMNQLMWPLDRLIGATAPPALSREDDAVQNIQVPPGSGALRLILPTGDASTGTARAWISAVVNGPSEGSVHYWFQNDQGGMADAERRIGFRDGRSDRFWHEFPNACTQVNVAYDLPDGGVLCLETMAK